MKYTISKKELSRRMKAFATLSASLTAGVVLASFVCRFPVSAGAYLCIACMFLLLCGLLFKLFNSFARVIVCLTDQQIERIHGEIYEKYLIADIRKIRIKRTKNHSIREIHIEFRDKKGLYINALDEFENFLAELKNSLNTDVFIEEVREPIDFDHPLFYSVLGFPVSFLCIFLLKLIANMDVLKGKYFLYVFAVYLFSVGLYFLFKKPLSQRFGNTKRAADYTVGLFLAVIAAGCLIAGLFLFP